MAGIRLIRMCPRATTAPNRLFLVSPRWPRRGRSLLHECRGPAAISCRWPTPTGRPLQTGRRLSPSAHGLRLTDPKGSSRHARSGRSKRVAAQVNRLAPSRRAGRRRILPFGLERSRFEAHRACTDAKRSHAQSRPTVWRCQFARREAAETLPSRSQQRLRFRRSW